MSQPFVPALIDTVDSYYQFVKNNVQAANPARVFGGIAQARDWPQKGAVLNAPYLLLTQDAPTRSAHQSFYQVLLTYSLVWVWMIQGDDLSQGSESANRGDKYRQNMQMVWEILAAHNPGYCQKYQYSLVADANNLPLLVATPYTDPDFLWWQIPSFSDKQDKTSGILYCQGKVEVSSYSPITASS